MNTDLFEDFRSLAVVHLHDLVENFRFLLKTGGYEALVPMVKCNAYGHGVGPVSRVLSHETGLEAFGVATLEEGIELRRLGVQRPIWVFSEGSQHYTAIENIQKLEKGNLTPVLHHQDDVQAILKYNQKRRTQIRFHLKWNTGMNRLGLDLSQISSIQKKFQKIQSSKSNKNFEGICTHFGCSDQKDSLMMKEQLKKFKEVVSRFEYLSLRHIHAANSAALLQDDIYGLSKICSVARPGISLYGYSEVETKNSKKLKPVLELSTRVLHQRTLSRGDLVGYGATYKCKTKTEEQWVLGMGYGDGIGRSLSNKKLFIELGSGETLKVKVSGRVSMDLMSIVLDKKKKSSKNQWCKVLGSSQKQGLYFAEQSETNIYEVLTRLSTRVPRVYALD